MLMMLARISFVSLASVVDPVLLPPTPTLGAVAWASIVGMPDLSLGPFGNASFNTPCPGCGNVQPVDFGIWQAADGSWQLQSCIRNTGIGAEWNHSRLFYRWESTATNASAFPTNARQWHAVGVVMIGEQRYGENQGGLQAPHVTRWGSPPIYHMFYGSWEWICQATSVDGKHFTRVLNNVTGHSTVFSEGPGANTRDPMLFAIEAQPDLIVFRIVYSAFPVMSGRKSDGVWSRTLSVAGGPHSSAASARLVNPQAWAETRGALVGYGGSAGKGGSASECPFVFFHRVSGYYFLFRTQHYTPNGGQTSVYASFDPSNFGVGYSSDAYLVARLPICAPELVTLADGRVLIVALNTKLDGFRVTELTFEPKAAATTTTISSSSIT